MITEEIEKGTRLGIAGTPPKGLTLDATKGMPVVVR